MTNNKHKELLGHGLSARLGSYLQETDNAVIPLGTLGASMSLWVSLTPGTPMIHRLKPSR